MEEVKKPLVVRESDKITPEGGIQEKLQRKLFRMALETYENIMINGDKAADRKAAADAVVELLGKKRPKESASASFNFNIPPEYFKRVFGEGLPKLTEPPVDDNTGGTGGPSTLVPFRVISTTDEPK